jgi:hypothetical protein
MSSLISESPLVFSPQLAATIGLEESILLQVLCDAAELQENQPCNIATEALRKKLSFWSVPDLQRILKSLSDKGVLILLSPPATQSQTISYQFDQAKMNTGQTTTLSTTAQNAPSSLQQGANRISPHWQPNETVLGQLAQHNIPANYAQQQIAEFVTYWQDRGEIAHSWSAKFLQHVNHKWQRNRADVHFLPTSDEPAGIQQDWSPSIDAMEILQRNGINQSFIEDAIPEFTLYWRERGGVTNTWNSKFLQHIKRQWARYTSTLQHDTEPRRIPANWLPDPEVYEILVLANIDSQFAQNVLQEFVLYWKDSNQLYSSWNTKFLQHVKYCWANQHQLQGLANEGQQNTSGSNKGATGSFVAKHTDRSWREGL